LKSAGDALIDIQLAVKSKNEDRLQKAMKQFHEAFDPVLEVAKGQ
jgi:hypothetical protein